jgi:hypothetical protein
LAFGLVGYQINKNLIELLLGGGGDYLGNK